MEAALERAELDKEEVCYATYYTYLVCRLHCTSLIRLLVLTATTDTLRFAGTSQRVIGRSGDHSAARHTAAGKKSQYNKPAAARLYNMLTTQLITM